MGVVKQWLMCFEFVQCLLVWFFFVVCLECVEQLFVDFNFVFDWYLFEGGDQLQYVVVVFCYGVYQVVMIFCFGCLECFIEFDQQFFLDGCWQVIGDVLLQCLLF